MSEALVMDASVVFAWVLPSQASPGADALLTRIEAGATVAVPSSEMTEWEGELILVET